MDSLTKLFAPILAFTCDEIWLAMPHRSQDDGRNVLFNEMNQPFTAYALDDAAMGRWAEVIRVRDTVNGGMGAVTPIGIGVEEFWAGIQEERIGFGPITSFDASGYKCRLAAEVKAFEPHQGDVSERFTLLQSAVRVLFCRRRNV